LELGIRITTVEEENIDRQKIIERKLSEITCECGSGSDQYNDLFNNFTGQLQTLTDDFNNQISALQNSITSLQTYPFSANNVNYVDTSNITKNLQTYLKSVDSKFNYIPTLLENISIEFNRQITNLTTSVCECDNISTNFTINLNSIESIFNTKISTLENIISTLTKFHLSANAVVYILLGLGDTNAAVM
jgi:septation ring formation regulator EzrA